MKLKIIKIISISLILYLVIMTSILNASIPSDNNDGIDKIRKLEPYNYTYKADKEKTPHVGVMAQDLQKVFPNAVLKRDDGYLMIRQEDMFYAMLNSIKQLDKIVQKFTSDVKLFFVRIQKVDDKIVSLNKSDNEAAKKVDELDLESKTIDMENQALEARLAKLEKNN